MTPLEHTLLDLVTADHLAELPLAAERALAQASDDDARLEVLVARIRKKLGAGAVRTVRGEGYAID